MISFLAMQINLLGSSSKSLKKCRDKINSYLKRLMVQSKIEPSNDNGVFRQWNQYMINAFYFYCKERRVLPAVSANNSQVIELYGSTDSIQDVREKYGVSYMLVFL